MAREYKEVPYQASRRECVKFTCDCCGKDARFPTSDQDAWGNGLFDVATTTVECKVGKVFPEGGTTTTTSFDVCVECFKEKLVPFLKSLGAKPTEEECNY